MELYDKDEFRKYIEDNYPLVHTSSESRVKTDVSGSCDFCGKDAFFKLHSFGYNEPYGTSELGHFIVMLIECPNCLRKSFIQFARFMDSKRVENTTGGSYYEHDYKFYKLYRIPISNESYLNEDIPKEYTSLRQTIREANYCLSKGKYIASSILFRRGIEILAKDILGAQGFSLHKKLEWLKVNENQLKVDLSDVFHDNSKIIKDIGNQGAHPDDDVTLHSFKKEDAEGMHDLFLSIIHEVFVKPERLKSLQEELKANRKLK
jgi:hypothetical protein